MNKKNRGRRIACCALLFALLLSVGLCSPRFQAAAATESAKTEQRDLRNPKAREAENEESESETEIETEILQTKPDAPQTESETPQTESEIPQTESEVLQTETEAPQTEAQKPSRPKKVKLSRTAVSMTRGQTFQLALKGAERKIRWKSSKPLVAVVDKTGRIKAKRAGKCVITAKYEGKKYKCSVRVYDSSKQWRPDDILAMYKPKRDKNKVILAGSSYMERWEDAEGALAPFEILNMGISGSKADDWLSLYRKLIVPYKPKVIILCSGDNNMHGSTGSESGSATAEKVIRLLKLLRRELPDTEIYYVSVAPNPKRWHVWPQMKECNRRVEQYCKTKKRLHFIDMSPHLLKRGKPQKKLYHEDRLHLNKKGYKIWGEVIGKRLRRDLLP